MYKEKLGKLEIYFLCYKKEEMELIESYYDPILDIYYIYINGYLAYLNWQNKFKKLKNIKKSAQALLSIAAYIYLNYQINENKTSYKLDTACLI